VPDGVRPSPNIWYHHATYEVENNAFDPEGLIKNAMHAIAPWENRAVLDIGCGTGFHLPMFAATAAHVFGVEPHPDLLALARRRTRRLSNVTVTSGVAQTLPLSDSSIDVAHARWAYFFGPGSEPGLAELARVMRPGATAFVLDNDASTSTFGGWFGRGYPHINPERIALFWQSQGWHRQPMTVQLRCETRADFADVLGIEFPSQLVTEILAEHTGCEVDYAVNLWWRTF
jgi:SAM-dependent methyltransferase